MIDSKFLACIMLAVVGMHFFPECIAYDSSDEEDLADLEKYASESSESESEDEGDSTSSDAVQKDPSKKIDFLERTSGLSSVDKEKVCDRADLRHTVTEIHKAFPSLDKGKIQIAYDNCLMDEYWEQICFQKKQAGLTKDIIKATVNIPNYLFDAVYNNCNYVSPNSGN